VAIDRGQEVLGSNKTLDVLSPRAQQQHDFRVESLPQSTRASFEHVYSLPGGQRRQDAFEERLRDNTVTPIPDQVSFRLDFPAWLKTRTERDRRVVQDLMLGERTGDVADKHGLTAGRVSQLRRDFMEDWLRFCTSPDEAKPGA